MKEFLSNFYQGLNKSQRIIAVALIFIITGIIFMLLYNYFYKTDEAIVTLMNASENSIEIGESGDGNNSASDESNKTLAERIGISQDKKDYIEIHLIGEVNKPGVVKLEKGARIIDAIEEAGGHTENANLSKINLAYVLEDGLQVNVPNYNTEDTETLIRSDAGDNVITSMEGAGANSKDSNSKVNINTATKEKLETLPGIGEATASRIIDYRNSNGTFSSIEEIKNVSGIGDAKYENIKNYIYV